MDHSETIGTLAKALSQAQGEMKPAPMNRVNPQFNSRYADLGSVIEAIQPVLAKNGLSFSQHASTTPDGEIQVLTLLMHSSGEWLTSVLSLPFGETKGNRLVQVMGSVITYMRRYALSAVFGVYADDDNDGNSGDKDATPAAESARAAVAERQQSAGRKVVDITLPIPNCPKCGGQMWDNREGKKNPKAPDYKCRDKGCDGAIWPERTAEEEWAEIEAIPHPLVRWNDNVAILKRVAIYAQKVYGLTAKEIHDALGVDSSKDFTGSLEEAGALLDAYAEKKAEAQYLEAEA